MKITKSKLKKIIQEELQKLLQETSITTLDPNRTYSHLELFTLGFDPTAALGETSMFDHQIGEDAGFKVNEEAWRNAMIERNLELAATTNRPAELETARPRKVVDIPDPRGGAPVKGAAAFPTFDELPVEEIPVGTDPFEFLDIE